MTEARPRRIVLDTDPGIDDALAILLALASPEVELRGLSVIGGNVPLEQCVRNALDVLALAGHPEVPVAAGTTLPLLRPLYTAPTTHGASGLGYARLPPATQQPIAMHGVDWLIEEILAAPGEVSLVAIGPLTNVALALRKAPQIVSALREVIYMGGALRVEGNTTPVAEFNTFVDPHAAQIVLQSGMPLVLLPWDITINVQLTGAHIERLLETPSPITQFVADATRFYIEFHEAYFGFKACSINDPAAIALVFLPELATLTPMYVEVETASELTMGQTVADTLGARGHEPNVRVVTAFDTARFMELFVARVEALARR